MSINGYKLILQDGGKELERVCPRCNHKKPLSEFGLRNMGNGEIRVQAECLPCRGK